MDQPKFYGRGYFIDVIDHLEETSGSASNPIVLDNNRKEYHPSSHHKAPLDRVTILSDSSFSDTHSPSSTVN